MARFVAGLKVVVKYCDPGIITPFGTMFFLTVMGDVSLVGPRVGPLNWHIMNKESKSNKK